MPSPSIPSPTAPYQPDLRARLYLWISAVFVTCLLLANILGVKLFQFGPYSFLGSPSFQIAHTVGMLPFPITFLLTDLVNEYFGRRAARRLTYIAFVMAVLALLLISLARAFPINTSIPNTATQESFENIFGSSTRMYIASILAFLLGSLLDISLFSLFKRLTGDRLLWLRATGSTLISQVFDSFLVTFLFFLLIPALESKAASPFSQVLELAAAGYILKFAIAVALTPAIYLGRYFFRVHLGLTPIPLALALPSPSSSL